MVKWTDEHTKASEKSWLTTVEGVHGNSSVWGWWMRYGDWNSVGCCLVHSERWWSRLFIYLLSVLKSVSGFRSLVCAGLKCQWACPHFILCDGTSKFSWERRIWQLEYDGCVPTWVSQIFHSGKSIATQTEFSCTTLCNKENTVHSISENRNNDANLP